MSVCVCLTPRLILFPEERFWLWRLAGPALLWTVEEQETGPKGATSRRPSLRGRGSLSLARPDSSLNEGWFRLPPSFLPSFPPLFVFLLPSLPPPPPYKFAGARLLSDAIALDGRTDTLPSLFFCLLLVFTDDAGRSETVLSEAFFGLAPLCERNQGIRKTGGGASVDGRGREVSNSIQSFFPRSIANGSSQRALGSFRPPLSTSTNLLSRPNVLGVPVSHVQPHYSHTYTVFKHAIHTLHCRT